MCTAVPSAGLHTPRLSGKTALRGEPGHPPTPGAETRPWVQDEFLALVLALLQLKYFPPELKGASPHFAGLTGFRPLSTSVIWMLPLFGSTTAASSPSLMIKCLGGSSRMPQSSRSACLPIQGSGPSRRHRDLNSPGSSAPSELPLSCLRTQEHTGSRAALPGVAKWKMHGLHTLTDGSRGLGAAWQAWMVPSGIRHRTCCVEERPQGSGIWHGASCPARDAYVSHQSPALFLTPSFPPMAGSRCWLWCLGLCCSHGRPRD